jgi:hypothetical protein
MVRRSSTQLAGATAGCRWRAGPCTGPQGKALRQGRAAIMDGLMTAWESGASPATVALLVFGRLAGLPSGSTTCARAAALAADALTGGTCDGGLAGAVFRRRIPAGSRSLALAGAALSAFLAQTGALRDRVESGRAWMIQPSFLCMLHW